MTSLLSSMLEVLQNTFRTTERKRNSIQMVGLPYPLLASMIKYLELEDSQMRLLVGKMFVLYFRNSMDRKHSTEQFEVCIFNLVFRIFAISNLQVTTLQEFHHLRLHDGYFYVSIDCYITILW
jgi:hypothetical protein